MTIDNIFASLESSNNHQEVFSGLTQNGEIDNRSEDHYFHHMRPRKERVTRLDYCQYLLVSQINYTLTNSAEHTEKFSHEMANRYLGRVINEAI